MARQLAEQCAEKPRAGAQRILSAAEKLFSRHGFSAVSMSAIAKEAGMSKANIYHHFSTKNELYLSVLKFASAAMKELIDNVGDSPGAFPQKLRHFADLHIKGLFEYSSVVRLILIELLSDGRKRGREMAKSGFDRNFSLFTRIIRKGQARGEIRPDLDPAMVACVIFAANTFLFQHRDVLRHYKEVTFADDTARYVDMLTDILLNGIAPMRKGISSGVKI